MKTISALVAVLIVAASLAFTAASVMAEQDNTTPKTAADWFDQE